MMSIYEVGELLRWIQAKSERIEAVLSEALSSFEEDEE